MDNESEGLKRSLGDACASDFSMEEGANNNLQPFDFKNHRVSASTNSDTLNINSETQTPRKSLNLPMYKVKVANKKMETNLQTRVQHKSLCATDSRPIKVHISNINFSMNVSR